MVKSQARMLVSAASLSRVRVRVRVMVRVRVRVRVRVSAASLSRVPGALGRSRWRNVKGRSSRGGAAPSAVASPSTATETEKTTSSKRQYSLQHTW